MSDLADILNFGPYMVKILNQIGIYSKEDLLNTDYLSIRNALIEKGIKPHLLIFYSIEMGLQDRIWSDIKQEEKKEIQKILAL
ncbi:MAG: TfoX/Sxy family DNA transformation protein [Chitinophagaceae bacterium]|jgi:hypothetical protein